MTVRPATVDDAAGIARVHAASWQVAYRGIVADSFLDGDDVTGFARIGPVRDPDPPGPGWDELYQALPEVRYRRVSAAGRTMGG